MSSITTNFRLTTNRRHPLSIPTGKTTLCSKSNTMTSNNNIRLDLDSGAIYSPDYATQNTYPPNITCTWVITAREGYHLQLSFAYLRLHSTASKTCSSEGDFVQIRDGDSSSSAELGTVCGDTLANVTSSGRHLWVRFKSDGSAEGRGFVANYRAVQSKHNCK